MRVSSDLEVVELRRGRVVADATAATYRKEIQDLMAQVGSLQEQLVAMETGALGSAIAEANGLRAELEGQKV